MRFVCRQTIWCILESKTAARMAAVFADFPDSWLEQSVTPHSTQYRSFRRRSSQPITWLILTNKTVHENTDKETQYKSEKLDNLKYSKTGLPWFSCFLQHSARKRGGLILQRPRAHTVNKCNFLHKTELEAVAVCQLSNKPMIDCLIDWLIVYDAAPLTNDGQPYTRCTPSHGWVTHRLRDASKAGYETSHVRSSSSSSSSSSIFADRSILSPLCDAPVSNTHVVRSTILLAPDARCRHAANVLSAPALPHLCSCWLSR